MSRVWTATIEALDGADNPVTLRFADGGFVDDEANFYEPRMRQPALMRVMANAGALLPGLSRSSIGEIELVNADGGLNHLAGYALDGRECVIDLVQEGVATEYFRGTVTSIQERGNLFSISLRPGFQVLEQPYPLAVYAGDNALPDGLEGGEELEGSLKPVVFGRVFNGSPVLVNTARLIYQASDQLCVISNVRDRGIELTRGADYTDAADMQANAPAAGQFRCLDGYFRLGDTPSGQITFDASAGAAGDRLAGALLTQLLAGLGLTFCSACATELDGISGECGFYLTDNVAVSALLARFAESLGFCWYYDAGLVKARLLDAPAGGGMALEDWAIMSAERRATAAGSNGLPVRQVRIPIYQSSTVQTDLAAGATNVIRARVGQAWRWRQAASAATAGRHPLSEPLEITAGVSFDGDAIHPVCVRLRNLLSVRRDLITIDAQIGATGAIGIGDEVTVYTRRLGYETGRDMICLGYELNARKNRITLELFG